MFRLVLIALLLVSTFAHHGDEQVQMPDNVARISEGDLEAQVRDLQKNVSALWSYIYELRNAVGQHLTHLRQHQVELESHHKGAQPRPDSHSDHGASHDHSSSSGDHHADDTHGGDHAHGHSHSGEHHSHDHASEGSHDHHSSHGHASEGSHDHHSSHGHDDEHHSHSHSGEQHSQGHSGEHHSHDHVESSSHSHDHGESSDHTHDHDNHDESHGHGHDDHQDHRNSHEKDDTQQKPEPEPSMEPVVLPTQRARHHHHHGHHHTTESEPPKPTTNDPLRIFPDLAHHHHELTSDHRSNITAIPKYSEYNLYRFAICNMSPNRAIAEHLQQEVKGQVSFWQRKTGGPIGIHVRVQGFSVAGEREDEGEDMQQQMNEAAHAHHGAEGGHRHGFHVHTFGDLSDSCQSTGPHYNPKMVNHGSPKALIRHVGDFGNIECDENGVTNIVFSDDIASLSGQYSIVGKSLVIHANTDDYGLKKNDLESLKTGNAGTRIACCIIEHVEKLPIRLHKALKSATQHQNR